MYKTNLLISGFNNSRNVSANVYLWQGHLSQLYVIFIFTFLIDYCKKEWKNLRSRIKKKITLKIVFQTLLVKKALDVFKFIEFNNKVINTRII